jgi:hypothetical protein
MTSIGGTLMDPNAAFRPTRRTLLRAGVLGALGLGLGDWLRLRAAAGPAETPGRAQACILIWLSGGPSHIDTFDPKPDAPPDVRGELQAIETAIPGVRLSELFPEMARSLDRFTLVRSLTSPEAEHDRASHHMQTGYRPSPALVYPSVGSVVHRIRGASTGSTLPTYIAVPEAPPFGSSGYLTPAFDPFSVNGDPNAPGFHVRDLTPPDRLTLERLRRRQGMVGALDRFARDVPESSLTTSRDQFARKAFELLTSADAQAAFRIDDEPGAARERYGRTLVGQACLLARRLVERGVAFVTINDRGAGVLGWDTHVGNFPALRERLAPPIDRAVSTLVADLAERGLLESTLVVMMGEFGRTPKINGNAGRDHHGRASTVVLAGGGLRAGVVLGRTDAKGDSPVERPVTPSDLAATVFTALGIDPSQTLTTPDQQPIRLVDSGQAVAELFA